MNSMNFMQLFNGDSSAAACMLAAVAFVAGFAVAAVVLKVAACSKGTGNRKAPNKREPQQKTPARRPGQDNHDDKFNKKHPAPADGSIEIYVGNLSYDVTDDVLRKEFEAYGKVNYAHVVTNRYNNKSKGFGFVHMPNRAEVDAAVAALDNKEVMGRKIKCNEAKNVG